MWMRTQQPPDPPDPLPRARGSVAGMLATSSAVTAVVAIFLIAIGMAMLAVPVAILFVILAAAAAFDAIMARRKLARHGGDLDSVEADENDALPTMVSDEEAPLGATSQAHEDIDPHDLPPDHPSRQAVEDQSRRAYARTPSEDR